MLDGFKLSDYTYLLFFAAIDMIIITITIVVWSIFRLATQQANPPQLHFLEWIKGFELHPVLGLCVHSSLPDQASRAMWLRV